MPKIMKRAFKFGQIQLRVEVICCFWPVAINNTTNMLLFLFLFFINISVTNYATHTQLKVALGAGHSINKLWAIAKLLTVFKLKCRQIGALIR